MKPTNDPNPIPLTPEAFRTEFGVEGEAYVHEMLQNPGGDPAELMDLYARIVRAAKGGAR